MKSKYLIFLIGALFLSGCGYELPKTANGNGNSAPPSNQAANQSNANKPATNVSSTNNAAQNSSGNAEGGKLILDGTGESTTIPCNGREVEVDENSTANSYTLTGECKKITVDGVSNKIKVDKVGEIVVRGVSNTVTYGEGLNGGKPKISKSGRSAVVETKAEAEKKAAAGK
jgi:hypothetical protein